MSITLTAEARKTALASIRRYARDELELDLGDLRAGSLLDFFLREIGPTVYNGAVADAQAFLRDRLADLEATCYEPEFTYWPKSSATRRP